MAGGCWAHFGKDVSSGSLFADPRGRMQGWVDIYAIVYNLRSGAFHNRCVVEISGHAIARLLERRRDVDVQTLLAEELTLRGVAELIRHHKTAESFETVNGEFRLQREEGDTLVAATWIPRK